MRDGGIFPPEQAGSFAQAASMFGLALIAYSVAFKSNPKFLFVGTAISLISYFGLGNTEFGQRDFIQTADSFTDYLLGRENQGQSTAMQRQ